MVTDNKHGGVNLMGKDVLEIPQKQELVTPRSVVSLIYFNTGLFYWVVFDQGNGHARQLDMRIVCHFPK